MINDEIRFTNKVEYDNDTDCWNWVSFVGSDGYGKFWDKKSVRAHRWSYKNFIGDLTYGLDICHHCDNRRCVNPFHLFKGTRKENMQDCAAKKRFFKQKAMTCKLGHEYSFKKNGYRYCKECNKKHWAKHMLVGNRLEVKRARDLASYHKNKSNI